MSRADESQLLALFGHAEPLPILMESEQAGQLMQF
jgi:hypothetical protein